MPNARGETKEKFCFFFLPKKADRRQIVERICTFNSEKLGAEMLPPIVIWRLDSNVTQL